MRLDSVRVAIVHSSRVVLGHRRSIKGSNPKLILPGGRMKAGETIEQAAVRIALEQTGLSVMVILWYVLNSVNRDNGEPLWREQLLLAVPNALEPEPTEQLGSTFSEPRFCAFGEIPWNGVNSMTREYLRDYVVNLLSFPRRDPFQPSS